MRSPCRSREESAGLGGDGKSKKKRKLASLRAPLPQPKRKKARGKATTTTKKKKKKKGGRGRTAAPMRSIPADQGNGRPIALNTPVLPVAPSADAAPAPFVRRDDDGAAFGGGVGRRWRQL